MDDFDVTYSALAQLQQKTKIVAPADDSRNKRKIQEKIQSCPITVSSHIQTSRSSQDPDLS